MASRSRAAGTVQGLTKPRRQAHFLDHELAMKDRFRQPIWMIPLLIAGLVALIGWYGNSRLRRTIETQLKADRADP